MDRCNQKYDAWLHWVVTLKCNLSCAFCSLPRKQQKNPLFEKLLEILIRRYRLKRTILSDAGKKINIPSLIKALEKTNKIFRVGFTGGEPFLISNFVEACEKITKKHYIALNTNLTSDKIKGFCKKVDPLRVVHFHTSPHIKELERLDLLDRYISNFLLCKEKGFIIFAQEVAYPPLLAEAEKYKRFFNKKGIELTFEPFMGEHNGKRYPRSYTAQEIEVFGLNKESSSDIESFYQKGKLCNAGYNVGVVGPCGEIKPCFATFEIMGHIYGEIKFKDKLIICPHEFCSCLFKDYDRYLFEKALEACGATERY